MNDDCVTVDELLLEIADYASNDQEMAAEKLERLCTTSYEAYSYLQDRACDPWLSERARKEVLHVLMHVRMRLYAFEECGWRHPEA